MVATKQLDDGACLVSLGGELDLHTAARLRDELFDPIEAGAREVVVDLTCATHVDSTTIGVLVIAENALERSGRRLTLVCKNPTNRARLEAAGLTRLFDVRADNGDALH